MKNEKLLSLIFLSLVFAACGLDRTMRTEPQKKISRESPSDYGNNSYTELSSNVEIGKCYAQYTGNEYDATGAKRKIFVLISPATTRWEKGKADPNCKSQNPQDCEVMCLVDVPAVYGTYFVSDTSIIKQKNVKMSFKRFKKEYGETGWVEVLCEKDITYNTIIKLQQALNDRGYDIGAIDGIMGPATKADLSMYQQDNNLPEGHLNIETLKHLGVL